MRRHAIHPNNIFQKIFNYLLIICCAIFSHRFIVMAHGAVFRLTYM